MEARKFAIGDRVRLLDKNGNDNPADVCTISRELPPMANVWQYRAKRIGDSQERAVNEQQLAKVGPRPWASMLRRKRNKTIRECATPAPLHELE
jgi:hypothetical protein